MTHPSVIALWDHHRSGNPTAPINPPKAEHFCDNEVDSDICVDLILSGRKRATSSALVEYEMADEPLPQPGKFIIVTNWSGEAKALIQTHAVTIRRFADVPETFAFLEGEGDASLAWWQQAHRTFWMRTLTEAVDDNLQIVCEEFSVVLAV